MRISHDCFANFFECRENFHVSRTRRELVAKVLNMFKNFMRIFSPKYFARLSRDRRATVPLRSCECRESVAAKFWPIYNAKFSRHSRDSLEKTSRLSGERIKLSDIRTNVVRHSHECRATLARMSRDCRTN